MKFRRTLSGTLQLCILVLLVAGVGALGLHAPTWMTPLQVALGQGTVPPPGDGTVIQLPDGTTIEIEDQDNGTTTTTVSPADDEDGDVIIIELTDKTIIMLGDTSWEIPKHLLEINQEDLEQLPISVQEAIQKAWVQHMMRKMAETIQVTSPNHTP